jgi:hypothetical protein
MKKSLPYFAKITDAPMTGEWFMEVDWVKHQFRK